MLFHSSDEDRYAGNEPRNPTKPWTSIIKRAYDRCMRNIPPLAAIRVFESAARHLNFTRAAEELNMTQAAVSYQIRVLEERIGVKLFHRVARRVELTDIGERIAPIVSRAFDGLDDAFAVARADNENVLTISCSKSFSSEWLAFRLGIFQVKHPDIAVRLDTTDVLVDFASTDVDVAIRTLKQAPEDLTHHFLMRTPMVAVASPDFVERHPPVKTANDVLDLPRMSPNDMWWNYWAVAQDIDPPAEKRGGIRLDSQVMDANAAIAGHGVALVNPILWRNSLRRRDLVQIFDGIGYEPSDYYLVYPEHKRRSEKVAAFRKWILAEFVEEAKRDTQGFFRPRSKQE